MATSSASRRRASGDQGDSVAAQAVVSRNVQSQRLAGPRERLVRPQRAGQKRRRGDARRVVLAQRNGKRDQGIFLVDELGPAALGHLAADLRAERPIARRVFGRRQNQLARRAIEQAEALAKRPLDELRGSEIGCRRNERRVACGAIEQRRGCHRKAAPDQVING